jgi:hypothetical protein
MTTEVLLLLEVELNPGWLYIWLFSSSFALYVRLTQMSGEIYYAEFTTEAGPQRHFCKVATVNMPKNLKAVNIF